MKRIFLFMALFVLVCSCADRNQVIENPISQSFQSVFVYKVEMTDSMTIVHSVVVGNNGWFRMEGDDNGECYLQGVESGRKYKYLGIAQARFYNSCKEGSEGV